MDKQKRKEQMQEAVKKAKEFRARWEKTIDPNVFLSSPGMPERSAMRQFIKRATDNDPKTLQDILDEVKASKDQIETLYNGKPSIKEPGYKFYRNAKALIEFIEAEYLKEKTTKPKGKRSNPKLLKLCGYKTKNGRDQAIRKIVDECRNSGYQKMDAYEEAEKELEFGLSVKQIGRIYNNS